MKKLFYFITLALCAISCAKGPASSSDPSVQGVKISARHAASSKVTLVQMDSVISASWEKNDQIGVFCSAYKDGNYPFEASIPDVAHSDYAEFLAVNSYQVFPFVSGSQYYAYYPFNKDILGDAGNLAFEVPAVQQYSYANPISCIPKNELFVAEPYTVADSSAKVEFEFSPLFPVIQLNLTMTDGSPTVPITRLVIKADAPLSGQGRVDITDLSYPLDLIAPTYSVEMPLTDTPWLTPWGDQQFYFVALPGAQTGLTVEITAINNAVCTKTLPAVTLQKGCNYMQTLSLQESDFVEAEPFAVSATSLVCEAGSSLTFDFSGKASAVDYWSGEKFHDIAYKDKDRMDTTKLLTSFWRGISAGWQPDNTKVMVSTDFNGGMNETDILDANWTDITSHFYLYNVNPENKLNANPITTNKATYDAYMHASTEQGYKEYDIAPLIGDEENQMYFAFFYHIHEVSGGPADDGRTQTYITRLQIGEDYKMDKDNITLVHGDNYTTYKDTKLSTWQVPAVDNGVPDFPAFRFFSSYNKFQGDRDVYAIVNKPFHLETKNCGNDKAIVVKTETDETPVSYTYTFKEAGTYKVVFVSSSYDITGSYKSVEWPFTVTVNKPAAN